MAQLVAHHTGSVGVRGSSPLSSTQIDAVQKRVERDSAPLERLFAATSAFGPSDSLLQALTKARLGDGPRVRASSR